MAVEHLLADEGMWMEGEERGGGESGREGEEGRREVRGREEGEKGGEKRERYQ